MTTREDLQRQIGKTGPAIVRVMLVSGEAKDLRPPNGTRKRWIAILDMLERMEWKRIELLDQRGALLDMIDNAAMPATAAAITVPGGVPRDSDDPTDRALARMVQAQREAATWQDKSVRAALDTMVQVMAQMAEATQMIVEMHRTERANLQGLVRELERALKAAAGEPAADGMPQDELVKQLAPIFLAKLMAPAPATPQ